MSIGNYDDGRIAYARYTVSQLREALHSIDRDRYPANFANLVRELEARSTADDADAVALDGEPERPKPPDPPLRVARIA